MTDKKEKILSSALDLFANNGVNATSTSKIAKKAGVSEGLIFRHFSSKKSLLDSLMQSAEEQINLLFEKIYNSTDPKTVLRKTIELPFSIKKSEYDFWKLHFKLKWEEEYNNQSILQLLIDKLTWAFQELEFDNPKQEAFLLTQIMQITSTDLLKGNLKNKQAYKDFLINRYIN
ncbi:TetR/AcrR family transcriptional regulator [Pseudofulvibacter geojedonensis]|uniref:TetR/AcrR family transcriptional regulator n=1 Tax=Pseudofulvibacter geojedonensis TaxID=1123758 RepID=A0ABW3I1S2_9FLAO